MCLLRFYLFRPLLFACFCSCFARAIVVSYDTNGKGDKSGDRGLIVEDVTNAEKEREEFSKSTPCIASFLNRAADPAWTSLMILDDTEDVGRSFATSLQDRFAFLKYSGEMEFDTKEYALNAILLMSNATSFRDDVYAIDPCTRDCPFFVVMTDAFRDEDAFLEETDALIRAMWTRRIFTVLVLARVGHDVLAARATSFRPEQPCAPSFPIVLDKCGTSSWDTNSRTEPPKGNKKCILRIAYFDEPPYVIATNETGSLLGFEGMLTEEVLRNRKVERAKVTWSGNATFVEQIREVLYQENADLVVGRVLLQPQQDIDYSSSYDMLKVVWLIPKVTNVSLKGLIQPFHPYVWAALGGALILAVLVKIFLIPDLAYLDIFALIIGASIATRPGKLSAKIQYISWSIFGLFLMEVYVDALADQLINTSETKITTTEELLSSSFGIGGTTAFEALFLEDALEEGNGGVVFSRIHEKFVTFDRDEYVGLYNDIVEGKNSSYALMILLNSSRSEGIDTLHAYTMSTDVIYSFPLALAVWKGFPKLKRVNTKIRDFIDTGIFDHMIKLAIQKGRLAMMFEFAEEEEYKMNLHLQHFVPAFLLMIIGFSIGFLSIIVEIALYPSELLFFSKNKRDNF